MKRIKRHKIKRENPESSSYSREHEEHDLAYYIHDRVELMHQVFSCLKYKEIKAMAPECVRNLAVGDLQELCTEELLGISSKRLLATLDGAEPPSDTESSSGSPTPDPMETISLDSISSDEEILSQSSKKKKHKHRRNSKSKKKRDKAKAAEEPAEACKASRAGLTVLELLELQARARAIRAQLQNEQAKKRSEAAAEPNSNTDDEVEIKEEAPDVVEISSGDEKPDLTALQLATQKSPKPKEPSKPKEPEIPKETSKSKEPAKSQEPTKSKEPSKPKEPQPPKEPDNTQDKENPTKTITRKSSELTITVPQAKTTRKIKLNRNKVTITVPNVAGDTEVESRIVTIKQNPIDDTPKDIDKTKKKQKKNKKKKSLEKEGSDHDEITLQLSDSEKMDLLEDLNEKNYERLSTSTSDSESSSSDSEKDKKDAQSKPIKSTVVDNKTEDLNIKTNEANDTEKASNKTDTKEVEVQTPVQEKSSAIDISDSGEDQSESIETTTQEDLNLKENTDDDKVSDKVTEENIVENQEIVKETISLDNTVVLDTTQPEIQKHNDQQISVSIAGNVNDRNGVIITEESMSRDCSNVKDAIATQEDSESNIIQEEPSPTEVETEKIVEISAAENAPMNSEETPSDKQELDANVNQETEDKLTNTNKTKESERKVSEGELSDRESSEVEAVDIAPEVVCISDDEKQISKKKKKKKDKKAKKDKKSKKSKQDFREGADQNFYKETDNLPIEPDTTTNEVVMLIDKTDNVTIDSAPIDVTDDDDDVYEILELSDDSSCYEVEGTVLSKEPTAGEIEALSARIDEIKREDIIIDEEIHYGSTTVENDNSEQMNPDDESETEAHMSWKDRYLDSTKVKRVLTTANILNAMRKKNRKLKQKMDEAKKKEKEVVGEKEELVDEKEEERKNVEEKVLEEGSIEHYQTLQASFKYVNPVTDRVDDGNNEVTEKSENEKAVTKEMKKDAKQLLKMFRRLLNSKKIKHREKKKKRKQKKKHGDSEAAETISSV